ncbi:urate hydroxylase PuuD [Kordiimonas sp. SCSIO 12603]|uniref:urate hydroxylase PuuD n=1 Tax=Kordiimonas sp. SCSIO 12603 TaxID=2829596 RepID=UPI0021025F04|nr:urate hydroxylase PuuD [Kordiimonas sp. SCSIO 12603]UTW57389.1 urate hydroxylase PuuD [Kordiimonas sp. SCSIO 12603]
MEKILGSLQNTVIAGFVITILVIAAQSGWFAEFGFDQAFYARYLHILAGVMWIGLLWYFNFVQIPTMPEIPDELKPAIGKHIAPKALFWFRWGAMITLLSGLWLATVNGYAHDAFMLSEGFRLIGIGMYLAIIMWFNVWFIIWPNQKIALGIVEADADAKPAAAKKAMLFSRTNTLLSIPMLLCMAGQSHGLAF